MKLKLLLILRQYLSSKKEKPNMKKDYLDYPEKFDLILADRVNDGCGPGGWKNALIPDDIFGICIKECCRIHDYEFFLGGNLSDFYMANHRFYHNILLEIGRVKYSKFMNFWRKKKARLYFVAVRDLGDLFFNWKDGKNEYKERHTNQKSKSNESVWVNGESKGDTTT